MKLTKRDYKPNYATKSEDEVRKEYLTFRIVTYVAFAFFTVIIAIMFVANTRMHDAMTDLNITVAQRAQREPQHNFTGLHVEEDTLTLDNDQISIKVVQGVDSNGVAYYDVLAQGNSVMLKDELDGDNYTYINDFYYTTQGGLK